MIMGYDKNTYDQWKTDYPEPGSEEEHECQECGKPIKSEGFCSKACYKASRM